MQPPVTPWGPPPAQPFYPPPKRGPDLRSIMQIVMLCFSLPCLGVVTYIIATYELDKRRDLITFDNQLGVEAEVIVDGKTIQKVAPRKGTHLEIVKLPREAKVLEVRAGGVTTVSRVELAIPPRPKGESHGYRGLYVIGPPPATTTYVIAKMPYYAETPAKSDPPKVTRLGKPAPLVELPRHLDTFDIDDVDAPFLESESMSEGTKVMWRTRLCTVTGGTHVNCRGFPDLDELDTEQ